MPNSKYSDNATSSKRPSKQASNAGLEIVIILKLRITSLK